jgi:hypothetical protein
MLPFAVVLILVPIGAILMHDSYIIERKFTGSSGHDSVRRLLITKYAQMSSSTMF